MNNLRFALILFLFVSCSKNEYSWSGTFLYNINERISDSDQLKSNDSLYISLFISFNEPYPFNAFYEPIDAQATSDYKLVLKDFAFPKIRKIIYEYDSIEDFQVLVLDTSFISKNKAYDFQDKVNNSELFYKSEGNWIKIQKTKTFYVFRPNSNYL